MADKKLKKLVEKNQNFEFLESGKIHCKLTSHDIKPTLEEFESYTNSKGYKVAVDSQVDISDYAPYLELNKKDNKFLYCNLTKQKLRIQKSVIEKHVNGKRFLRLQKIHDEEMKQQAAKEEQKQQQLEKKKQRNKERYEQIKQNISNKKNKDSDDEFDIDELEQIVQTKEKSKKKKVEDNEVELKKKSGILKKRKPIDQEEQPKKQKKVKLNESKKKTKNE